MKFFLFCASAIAAVLCDHQSSLIYSPSYANVYFQGNLDGIRVRNAELKLPEKQQVPAMQNVNVATEVEDLTADFPNNSTKIETSTEVESMEDSDEKNSKKEPLDESKKKTNDEQLEISTEPESEQINFAIKNEKLSDGTEVGDLNEKGVYYIYHPNGILQKVVYSTKDNSESMEYEAQLNYQNVEPIREPIYTYDPRTFVLQRLLQVGTK